ncbi:MAG: DNA methyltransferase [Candidatus Omnitrophica bacterium]|nr:DNA methyltransferase [Candidatus Omnitrophota bacterium]
MNDYQQFLEAKKIIVPASGLEVDDINTALFPFQRDTTRWALKKGKAAIFAGTGLGKTAIQLEWANHIPGDVLILAPLAVSQQTVREGVKFGIVVNLCRSQEDVRPGVNITNYEMLHKFNPEVFTGIVLDESSILKTYDGKMRTTIIESFANTPFKLACTATPAPNDHMELGNHAEFLGVMTRTEMLSMFFVHDGGDTSKWRLKGHAVGKFWEWVASWAVMFQKPSDLGYEDNGFILPPLNIEQITVKTDIAPEGSLFAVEAQTLQERQAARQSSIKDRVSECARIVNSLDEPCIIWCNLNGESEALTKAIDGATEIRGSHSPKYKERAMLDFTEGRIKKLVTKPSIAGFGMNWQHCSKQVFVGLSDSFEQYYQAVRRCWRFGQTKQVDVYVITAETEGAVVANIQRKERDFEAMLSGMISATQEITRANIQGTSRDAAVYESDMAEGKNWIMYLGDCVEVIRDLDDNSIHYSIFSPPFASLYTYSNSERDMGNCKGEDDFLQHFSYLVDELYRVIMPGRLLSFHCMDIPAMKDRDGYIGLKDFPGDLLRVFQKAGFIYHSKVVIWKDPLIEATRTKALGLMHKQIVKDSAMCRQGLPDYLITVRKLGDNKEPVSHKDGFTSFIGENEPLAPKKEPSMKDSRKHRFESMAKLDPVYSHHVWRRYASPVWMDINPSNTLQRTSVREDEDERHICPLQLEVIERALQLWTNPGDLVLSPFAGIGSEGYVAVKEGRRFVGMELKRSYWEQGVRNLRHASLQVSQPSLFEKEA